MQNAPREHSAILLTFIKLPFVFKTFVLPIFEWLLKTGFTVVFLFSEENKPIVVFNKVLELYEQQFTPRWLGVMGDEHAPR